MKFTNKEEQIKYLKKQLTKFKKLSFHDSLTGLYNHRMLSKDIKKYLEEKERYCIDYYLLMIDVDNFKHINDTKGHLYGDQILKKIAKILKSNVRNIDKVYRYYNGDEFVIILKYINEDNVSDRIVNALQSINISASIGKHLICKNIFKKLDKLLYFEKRGKECHKNN